MGPSDSLSANGDPIRRAHDPYILEDHAQLKAVKRVAV
jgi:hypothetical protein